MSYGTLIATTTVGAGGAASIDFTSIPGTYTDLVLVYSSRSLAAGAADNINLAFNGSTASFTVRMIYGTGASVASISTTNIGGVQSGNGATASTFGNGIIYLPNYSGSTNKTYSADAVSENNAATASVYSIAGLWSNAAAITSLSITGGANFMQYSTASLYGILKGSGGASVA